MTRGQWLLLGSLGLLGLWWWLHDDAIDVYAGPDGVYGAPDGWAGPTTSVQYQRAVAINGNVPSPAVGPRAILPDLAPAAPTLGKIGVGAGTAIGAAAVGPGTVLGAAVTAGIAGGVGLLTWAIGARGLFRGGTVGVLINPARDQFMLQFGPSGTGPGSGFATLAAALSQITGEPDGSHYFKALIGATTKDQLVKATQDIQALLATYGVQVGAFEG